MKDHNKAIKELVSVLMDRCDDLKEAKKEIEDLKEEISILEENKEHAEHYLKGEYHSQIVNLENEIRELKDSNNLLRGK